MRFLCYLLIGCVGILGWLLYVERPVPEMSGPLFAIELASKEVDVEELAKRLDCINEGPVGHLPLIFQFRYKGLEKNPLEWIQHQSDDIRWIEEQTPRTRYKRDEL
jgi:hypothetical protein